jgi:elongation factor P--beta-lysine ligase
MISSTSRRTSAVAGARSLGVQISPEMEDYEVVQQVFEKLVEENTFDPCFVTRVASELIPLAKVTPGGKTVEVYELIINGQEISPGYSELNDPDVQRQRLEHQAGGRGGAEGGLSISSRPWSTACRRRAGSALASTGGHRRVFPAATSRASSISLSWQ